MRKLKLFMAACALMGAGQMFAQMTDVTSTYIVNPSFELGIDGTPAASASSGFDAPYSWTPTNLPTSGTRNFGVYKNDGNTPSNFGKNVEPADGTYYYLGRNSWASSLTTILTQTSKENLPEGIYVLKIAYKIAKTSGDLNPKGYLTLSVTQGETSLGSQNSAISASQNNTYFNTAQWTVLMVPFAVTSAGNVNFVITFNFNPEEVNIPQEAIIIDNVQLLKADNLAMPITNGTTDLYIFNEKEKQYLSAGQSWGTHATVDNYGQEVTATLADGLYTLKTQQYNKYLGSDLYMDNGTGAKWLFLETEANSGKYYMTYDGVNFMTSNGAGAEVINVTTPTDASVWTIVSKADRKTALASATVDNPANATFLIADANFNRNAINSVWNGTSRTSDNKTNLNLAGGNNDNMCAESYHATFSIKQTLSGLAAGVYGLTAQGFYRQDGSDNDHLPVFYLGDETVTFPLRTGTEGSMSVASTSFSAGSYTTEPIYVRVEANGSLDLGAKLENENYNLWCIWDNFQLTYYGDETVAAVKMKASVDAYNAAKSEAEAFTESSMFADDWTTLQDAITVNTLDLNDPSLTESALTTATANLVAANEAATAAVNAKTTYDTAVSTINGGTNVDLTSLVTNPGFEAGNTNGWTNSGAIMANAQNNSAFDKKQGTYYAERWHDSGTIDINQTVASLPAGIYKIEAYMYSDVSDAKLYVNSTEVSVSTSEKYTATVEIADKGSIKMGASCTLTNSTWICLDDFTLTYVGTVNDLTYTLATDKMGTDKSAAQSDAETTFLANKTLANYNALLTAIAEAEASVANYATLKTAIDKAEAVKDANNFVTAAATTEFEGEIETATAGWTNVTFTDAEATAEIAALGTAASAHHGNATGKAGNYLVSTWNTNTDGETAGAWDGYYINTWSTEGDNDGSNFSVPFFEYYVSNTNNLPAKTMTATLTGLENGKYEVEIWARVQRRSDADFNDNASMITMSVNGGTPVNIMDNTSNNVGSGASVMRLGRFTATGYVTDGTLTLSIDVKLGANVHWLSWRDVKYEKVSDATEAITISEEATSDPATSTCADVTLARSFNAGWNAVCLPFATTAFDGAEIAEFTGDTGGDNVTLNFTKVDDFEANKPYLVYFPNAVAANKTFNGVIVNPAEVKAEGNAFDFMGTYIVKEIAANNWVVSGGALKKASAAINLKATRTYFTPKSADARIARFTIDGVEATGISAVFTDEAKATDGIYNLQGQKVSGKMQKGIYIMNGKKVIK